MVIGRSHDYDCSHDYMTVVMTMTAVIVMTTMTMTVVMTMTAVMTAVMTAIPNLAILPHIHNPDSVLNVSKLVPRITEYIIVLIVGMRGSITYGNACGIILLTYYYYSIVPVR